MPVDIGSFTTKLVVVTKKLQLALLGWGYSSSELRESLSKRPPEDMRQLMRRIEEYKRLEDNRLQSKGKAPLINRSRPGVFPSRPRRDLRI